MTIKLSELEEYLKQLNPQKFSKGLFDCQKKALKELERTINESGSVILLRLPTGSGKTLIGIAPLIIQAYRNEWNFAPHLVYTLPYRSLVFHHSKVLLDDFIKPLNKLKRTNLSIDTFYGGFFIRQSESPQNRTYFHPRKRAADVIVSTLDIFLLTYAKQVRVGYHSEYAAGVLSSSYLIFDEVHSYQGEHNVIGLTYAILRKILKWTSLSGLISIVMTATLPNIVKKYLFEYVEEQGKLREFEDLQTPFHRSINYDPIFKKNQTIYHLIEDIDFLNNIKEHKNILIVLNTVEKAIDLFQRLWPVVRKFGIRPVLVHSRMTASTREERESELVEMRENRGCNNLVISTQVAESGLDVSFDLLITELAPPEALIQRSGRCVRWGGEGKLIITQPAGDLFHLPYQKEVIDCTRNILEKSDIDFSNPYDLQLFIDCVYDELPKDQLMAADSSINEVLDYFSVWTNPLLRPSRQELQVREGVPVTLCYLPKKEIDRLLDGKKEYTGEIIKRIIQGCFTIDLDVLRRNKKIIEHNIDGNKFFIGFIIYSKRENEDVSKEPVVKIEQIKTLDNVLTKNCGLFVNPYYYRFKEDYELGLSLTEYISDEL